MSVVVINNMPTQEDVATARKDYKDYIKITIDIVQEIIALGGEYHADAEALMIRNYNCKQENIWGGGYQISKNEFIVDALINIRPMHNNPSTDILDARKRVRFLTLSKQKFANIKSLL